jgi:hypothetical protein
LNTIRSAAHCKSFNRLQPSTIAFASFGSRNFSLFSRSVSSEHTPTQGKLAALESDANASPENTERQIELFKALLDGGAEQGVIARWEGALRAVCIRKPWIWIWLENNSLTDTMLGRLHLKPLRSQVKLSTSICWLWQGLGSTSRSRRPSVNGMPSSLANLQLPPHQPRLPNLQPMLPQVLPQ